MSSPKEDSPSPRSGFPVFCLTPMSQEDESAYREAFAEEKDLDWIEPYFVEWSSEANGGRAHGDLADMYRIWRSRKDKPPPTNANDGQTEDDGSFFSFFIDQQSLQHVGVIVADPDIYPLCHSKDGERAALELVSDEQRRAMEELTEKSQAKEREGGGTPRVSTEVSVSMWAGDTLSDFYSKYDEHLGERTLPYGRIPASGLLSAWCNLDISNMGMNEIVEFHGRKDEVEGEGEVFQYANPEWNETLFKQRYSEMIDESIEEERARLEGKDEGAAQ